ncbi:twin-arginine translocation signal domain-containing protein [Hyphomicrobium sp. D-2]|uniref:twin-arginine translocation signal domain-containing protein n=1 Tax=Hyphomicrobium sp. D-2 TaxID=3041621 RepID=UPI002458EBD8|nr:twin-arginine translocation signal domain-containing protein [Hyphomicrobium sp. D-2]MDH4982567.1 twin-arginine translocation signal domain-containing protein [Hyphomicrobium sp. D-2]
MDRRDFLKSTGAAAAASTLAVGQSFAADHQTSTPTPAINRGIRQLRLALPWADGFAGPADWANRLARSIALLGQGHLEVSLQYSADDGLAAVQKGDADLFFGDLNAHSGQHRAFSFFSGLPGECGLPPRLLNTWLTAGGGHELWDELGAEANIKPLLSAHTGPTSYLMASKRIETVSALAEHKMQINGLGGDVARGLGLEPVNMAPAQIADAIANGGLLAAECGGAIASYAIGLTRSAPYFAGTSINRNGIALALAINLPFWESLQDSEQAVLTAAAASEFNQSLAEEEAHRHLLHPAPDVEYIWPIAQELDHTIRQIADAVVAHVAGSDAITRRINYSFNAFRRSARHSESFIG